MPQQYDAIIVGAGPAGASLAVRLANAGRQVLLIDQAAFPRDKVCGECLAATALPRLAELGVDVPVRRLAREPAAVRIVTPGGPSISLPLCADSAESILGISRYELDRLLVERAQACCVELLPAHAVRSVLSDADGASGVEVTPSAATSPRRRFACRTLIAADGRNSLVVKQTGRVRRRGPMLVGFKQHAAAETAPPRQAKTAEAVEMLSFAGGYVGICRVEGNRANVCGLLPPGALRASRGSVAAALDTLLSGYGEPLRRQFADIDHWQTIARVQRQVATPLLPRVLYLGDAQGTIEPLAGQGIAMALESAAMAAELILAAEQIDRRRQQAYQAAWQSRFAGPIVRASRFGWLLRHPRLLAALIAHPPLPQHWKSHAAHRGYLATRLAQC